jgi:AraC-like DNA-binding protein
VVHEKVNRLFSYLLYMEKQGFSTREILQGTEITREQMNFPLFNPSLGDFHTVLGNIVRLSESGIGIRIGSSWRMSDEGVFGYALISSKSIKQLDEVWAEYQLLADPVLTYENMIDDSHWWIVLKESFPLGEYLPFVAEEHLARLSKTIPSLIDADDCQFKEVHLSYPAPKYAEIYQQIFNCEVKFGQRDIRVLLDAKHFDQQLQMANEEVFSICNQQCQRLVQQIQNTGKLSVKIKKILASDPRKHKTLKDVATHLNLGERSIRRQLLKEDTSFQAILDQVRKELAMDYLQQTRLSPKQIGFALGYTNASNFRRAFKSWTDGGKLSDYR